MKKTTLLLSAILFTSVANAGDITRSVTLDPNTTSRAAVQLFEDSDKLQIVGQKVDGKQTCWVEAFKGSDKFTSETVTTTRAKFKRNPLSSCISDEVAATLIKS